MKIKKAKMLKAMTVLVVALTVITVGSFRIAINTSAAETVKSTSDAPENNGVIYVEYSNVTPADYWGKKAPEYTGVDSNGVGYFFGGWYTKSGDTYAPVETKDGLTLGMTVIDRRHHFVWTHLPYIKVGAKAHCGRFLNLLMDLVLA